MPSKSDHIKHIVALNGGEIVGKTRLQKTLYFMEVLNLGFGFDFEYYHYGPYSDDVSMAVDDAKALGLIEEQWRESTHLRVYAVFKTRPPEYTISANETSVIRIEKLKILNKYDAIALELAATADFLARVGYGNKSWKETAIRKSNKATAERMQNALNLLSELNIYI